MEQTVRTVYWAAIQTSESLGLPVIIKPNSTLNQKFNINASVALGETEIPDIQYVAIGNGGHRLVAGADNIVKTEAIQHTPRDAGLYNQLPFVLRLPSNDLTVAERANYRLRRLEQHDNTTYVAYYLKKLDMTDTSTQLELRNITDGVVTSSVFNPSAADLSPTPPPINSGGVITTSGDYIAATAKVLFSMDVNDIAEFLNVINIIYGDPGYATISEIGLCSGVDRTVTGDFNGTSLGYTDAIAVQICSFISANYPLSATNGSLTVNLDLGSNEPLLVLS